MEIIDGRALAQNVRENLKAEVEELKKDGIIPKFAVILIGNDKASLTYVKSKNKACKELGIEYEEILLGEETTMQELLDIIDELNGRKDISGILLQSPIPPHLDINEAFRRINPSKDVDGFNPYNVGKLCLNQDTFVSCTPYRNYENARSIWNRYKSIICIICKSRILFSIKTIWQFT